MSEDARSSSQIVSTKKQTPNFLQAECPSCRPTKSQSTERKLQLADRISITDRICVSDTQMIQTFICVSDCPSKRIRGVNVQ